MIDCLFENITFLFFPLTLYIIYVAYVKNIDKKLKESLMDFAFYASLYLILRNISVDNYLYTITFANTVLLISYLKKHLFSGIIMSFIIIFFLKFQFNIFIVLLLFEYVFYLIMFLLLKKINKLHLQNIYFSFVLIRVFFQAFYYTYFNIGTSNMAILLLKNTFLLFVSLLLSYIALVLFKKCENIIDFNSSLNELNREKEIKTSLFKITHEIKNPLSVCRGYLDMIIQNDYKNYKKYIPIIDSEIKRTLLLMDDFLDYTKLKIEKEEVDIVYMLEELEEELSPLLLNNNVDFEFSLPDDEIYLDIDYKRIKQVFINVIKNSIEAKSNNMVINVELEEKDNEIEVVIKDTGVGMDEEVLNRIGENFYTTKPRGTGLGVSLSKEIIKLHGGCMKYESVLDKGTTVFIDLPKNVN